MGYVTLGWNERCLVLNSQKKRLHFRNLYGWKDSVEIGFAGCYSDLHMRLDHLYKALKQVD